MTAPIIDVRELTRRFGSFTAVDRVTFDVAPGEIFGYLGANGAGKSTTIRMLCGLLPPSDGSAQVAGVDVRHHPHRVKQSIGYMSQKFSLYLDLTVEENLSFFAGVYHLSGKRGRTRIEAALAMAGLQERRRELTSALPGGIRQRLALASALLHEPKVLYLDEPTAGVDPLSRRAFWKIIRRLAAEGTTIFVTTHHLDEAEYCGRVGLMVDGRLVALDTPEGLKREHVPGKLYAVSGDITAISLARKLDGVQGIIALKPFGSTVHVRVSAPLDSADRFEQLLLDRMITGCTVESAEVTLDDVFLELVTGSPKPHATGDDSTPSSEEEGA